MLDYLWVHVANGMNFCSREQQQCHDCPGWLTCMTSFQSFFKRFFKFSKIVFLKKRWPNGLTMGSRWFQDGSKWNFRQITWQTRSICSSLKLISSTNSSWIWWSVLSPRYRNTSAARMTETLKAGSAEFLDPLRWGYDEGMTIMMW